MGKTENIYRIVDENLKKIGTGKTREENVNMELTE
jgi:hypothetical protein